MPIKLGSTNFGNIYLGSTKIGEAYYGGVKVYSSALDPNPLNLPPYTMRFKFSNSSYNPDTDGPSGQYGVRKSGSTWTRVSSEPNVWDYHREDTEWNSEFRYWFNDGTVCGWVTVLGANTSNIVNMHQMFANSYCLTNFAYFDTSSVTNMKGMFINTYVQEPPKYNTHSVTTMEEMFYNCVKLETVPLFDTSNVTDMQQMFANCNSKLKTVPLFNTHNVTNMYDMFYKCIYLESVPLFDMSSVTITSNMFDSCSHLESVPLFNMANVQRMTYMFNGCSSLKNVPLFNTSSATNVDGMFNNCINVESGALALYTQISSQQTPPSSYSQCFFNCGSNTASGQADLAQIPASWGGTGV